MSISLQSVKNHWVQSVITFNELKQNPEAFQKIFLAALAAIQGTRYLLHLPSSLVMDHLFTVINSFDCYEWWTVPHQYLCPYQPSCIKIDVLVKSFDHLDYKVAAKARLHLKDFLDWMEQEGLGYATKLQFKNAFKTYFNDHCIVKDLQIFNPNQLEIQLKPLSIFKCLSQLSATFASVVCLPVFLNDWKLIDLSHYANQIGRIRLFAWVPSHTLDHWVRGALCLGFLFKFLEACRLLIQKPTSSQQRKALHWQLVTAAAECLFNTSILTRCHPHLIIALTFVAKSLGVLSILYAPIIDDDSNHERD